MKLPQKILRIHAVLDKANLPHAFGGALALAWCTRRARGTVDVDINIFVGAEEAEGAVKALPASVQYTRQDIEVLESEGQVRLWWNNTPVDIFLNTTEFHRQASQRVRWEAFAGESIPFLACSDLAIFKAFFNRTKDWADLEEMQAAGTLDLPLVRSVLVKYLGADDERIEKLDKLVEV